MGKGGGQIPPEGATLWRHSLGRLPCAEGLVGGAGPARVSRILEIAKRRAILEITWLSDAYSSVTKRKVPACAAQTRQSERQV